MATSDTSSNCDIPRTTEHRISEDIASLDSWTEALSPTVVNDEDFSILINNTQAHDPRSQLTYSRSWNDTMTSGRPSNRQNSPSGNLNSNQIILNPAQLSTVLNIVGNKEDETRVKSSVVDETAVKNVGADEPPAYNTIVAQPQATHKRPHSHNDILRNPMIDTSEDRVITNNETYQYTGSEYLGLPMAMSSNSDFHSWPSFEAPSSRTFPPLHSLPTIPVMQSNDFVQGEKMKNKFMSVWNNVKYGWTLKTKTTFRVDSPVWLLGMCYHIKPDDDLLQPGKKTKKPPSLEKFKQDFSSFLWFTYRQDFPQIQGTKLTSDCGWGCMLRSGQMMLARAFTNHYLGREWNVLSNQSCAQETYRKQIIRWFGDFPCDDSPFSMHRLVEVGKTIGKQPGDWFGPASVAYILRESMTRAHRTQIVLSNICLYVAQDCTVYKKDVEELCCTKPRSTTRFSSSTESEADVEQTNMAGEWKRAVVVLIPVRLGGEELNPVYTPCIKSLLAQDACIGIIGGKPKHSLYFVGWQEDKLIYLDPHYCQDAVDTRERNFPVQTYHCLSPRKVHVNKMDPSCTIGFYCRNKEEFDKFVQQTEEMVSPPKQKLSYPMFVFSEGRGSDVSCENMTMEEDRLLRIRHVYSSPKGRNRSATVESEEFVIL